MKRVIILFVISVVMMFSYSCISETPPSEYSIEGVWEWTKMSDMTSHYILFNSSTYERYNEQIEVYESGSYYYEDFSLIFIPNGESKIVYNITEASVDHLLLENNGQLNRLIKIELN